MLLPKAFRSLSRLSSALSAKASTLRSSLLILKRSISLWLRSVGTGWILSFIVVSLSFDILYLEDKLPRMSLLSDILISVFGFQGAIVE